MTDRTLALEQLLLRLRPLNRALQAAVERQARAAARLARPDLTPICVTENQVRTLLDDIAALSREDICPGESASLTPEEAATQEEIRQRYAAKGVDLPLDRLSSVLGLSEFEQEAVVLCCAPELDRSYERIYAYINDDLNRRYPSVDLLCSLTATTLPERIHRRHTLSRFGRLRRTGILQAFGESATELRQELRLAPCLFDFLTGMSGDITSLLRDPAEVPLPKTTNHTLQVDRETIQRLGTGISEGSVGVVGIWGPRHVGLNEVVYAIATSASHPLRQWVLPVATQHYQEQEQQLREAIQSAAAIGSLLWIPSDGLNEQVHEHLAQSLTDQLSTSQVPILLTGIHPWRPPKLLEARPYAELELEAPGYVIRRSMWEQEVPEVHPEQRGDLAARFRVGSAEVRAAVQMARTQALVSSNGHLVSIAEQLEPACDAVTRQRTHHFAAVVKPKRGPDDLILPASLHRQVLEVAQFFKVWPRVAEDWGFRRLVTGEGPITALFTGDSGTGKTLAAEVIAGLLKMPLFKVDLARIVSKWVGETEKHLDAAFREAEDSHAVLFFDEADALFGKRGEVQHGTDRYANLEVSYLLQRLEEHYGLVILASNLKDNIDSAFVRRFQIAIHFPRPEHAQRYRIWEIAFSRSAPVDGSVNFEALSQLDMTGAGIVNSARTAALIAADQGGDRITMSHIVRAIAGQYRREARILKAAELGPYAALLQEMR